MVKQTTHNRWSLGSIPSGRTKEMHLSSNGQDTGFSFLESEFNSP